MFFQGRFIIDTQDLLKAKREDSLHRQSFIALYHTDNDFAKEAKAYPTVAVQKLGVNVRRRTTVELVEDTEELIHIVMPLPSDSNSSKFIPDEIVQRYHSDNDFSQKMEKDPVNAPEELGFIAGDRMTHKANEGVKFKLVKDTDSVMHLVIPTMDLFNEKELEEHASRGGFILEKTNCRPGVILCRDLYIINCIGLLFIEHFEGQLKCEGRSVKIRFDAGADLYGNIFLENVKAENNCELISASYKESQLIECRNLTGKKKLKLTSNRVILRDNQQHLPWLEPYYEPVIMKEVTNDGGTYKSAVFLSGVDDRVFPKDKDFPKLVGVTRIVDGDDNRIDQEASVVETNGNFIPPNSEEKIQEQFKGWRINNFGRVRPSYSESVIGEGARQTMILTIDVDDENASQQPNWKSRAGEIFERLIYITSFAQGKSISSPILEVHQDNIIETEFRDTYDFPQQFMPVIRRRVDAYNIARAVTDSINIDEEDREKKYWQAFKLAIDFSLSSQTFNGISLLSNLVAIETVVTSLIDLADKDEVECHIPEDTENCYIGKKDKKGHLACKIINFLQGKNLVPTGIGVCELRELSAIRNKLAHQAALGKTHDKDWKNKIIKCTSLSHEILVRIILNYLDFEGLYCSYIDEKGEPGGTGVKKIESGKISTANPRNIEDRRHAPDFLINIRRWEAAARKVQEDTVKKKVSQMATQCICRHNH